MEFQGSEDSFWLKHRNAAGIITHVSRYDFSPLTKCIQNKLYTLE